MSQTSQLSKDQKLFQMGCQSHALPLPGQQSKNDEIFEKKNKIEKYSIVEKEGKGQICVALKDIKRGTLIYVDKLS